MIRLFRVFVPVGALTLLVSEMLLVSAAFTLATYFFLPVDPTSYLLYEGGLTNIVLLVFGILEYSRYFMLRNLLTNAVREGARMATVNTNALTTTDIQKAFIVACTHADNVDACLAKIK